MKIKVCGLKYQDNINALTGMNIDMIGYNFYPQSKRYVDIRLSHNKDIAAVGVFVKEEIDTVIHIANTYNLSYIQCHGDESVDYCKELKKHQGVIKVFRVTEDFDFSVTELYSFCDYFLFDTHTTAFGGSGHQFDWDTLDKYRGTVPFLLAGGIGPEDADRLRQIKHPQFLGVDINSKFEYAPGLKNIDLIQSFVKDIKQVSYD